MTFILINLVKGASVLFEKPLHNLSWIYKYF